MATAKKNEVTDFEIGQQLTTAEGRRKKLAEEYKAETRVPIYLSPSYAAYFGKVMTVSINGVSIRVRVDGSTQEVPQTYADEITSRRMGIDEMLNKMNRMSNVPANRETTPGGLNLF